MRRLSTTLVALALIAAACGGDDDADPISASEPATTVPTTAAPTTTEAEAEPVENEPANEPDNAAEPADTTSIFRGQDFTR